MWKWLKRGSGGPINFGGLIGSLDLLFNFWGVADTLAANLGDIYKIAPDALRFAALVLAPAFAWASAAFVIQKIRAALKWFEDRRNDGPAARQFSLTSRQHRIPAISPRKRGARLSGGTFKKIVVSCRCCRSN